MARITIEYDDGTKLDYAADEITADYARESREIADPCRPPCGWVHRELTGPTRITVHGLQWVTHPAPRVDAP